MSLRINHNTTALNAWRNLSKTDRSLSTTLEHLASGYRINRASDDPAGLVISEQMRAQIASVQQAIENAEIATSMIQTTEAYLSQVNDLLTTMRELATHAANQGANDEIMLQADQNQINNSIETINTIAKNARFGNKNLLDGSQGVTGGASNTDVTFIKGEVSTQTGNYGLTINTQAEKAVLIGDVDRSAGLTTTSNLVINGVEIELDVSFGSSPGLLTIGEIVDLINKKTSMTEVTASHDGTYITLTSLDYGSNVAIDLYDSNNVLMSVDSVSDLGVDISGVFTSGSQTYTATGQGTTLVGEIGTPVSGLTIRSTAPTGSAGFIVVENNYLIFQIGNQPEQTVSIAISDMSASNLGTGLDIVGNMFSSLEELDVTVLGGATDAIAVIESAINRVSEMRGELGAVQKNYLENNILNLQIAVENLTAAESVIRDTDMAAEITDFTKYQIMEQAATAMLAQANLIPQNVLQLLQ